MKFSAEIEARILAQLAAEPERELILPSWAYASGDQPVIYIGGRAVKLARYLHEKLVGPIPAGRGFVIDPDAHPRNVNPRMFHVTATPHTRLACPNHHRYVAEDWNGKAWQCHVCREEKNLGTPSVADVNRAKTHCPKNHRLAGDNLVNLKNGKRRCRTCHADTQAAYRRRKKENS